MNFVETPQCNHVWGAPRGQERDVGGLPVLRTVGPLGPVSVSFWKPTDEELVRLRSGEPVQLWIHNVGHPVVSMAVGATVRTEAPGAGI